MAVPSGDTAREFVVVVVDKKWNSSVDGFTFDIELK